MAFSKIEITFNRRVEIGENIQFQWRDLDVNGGASPFLTNEVCNNPRTRPGQFSYDLENGGLQEQFYLQAFRYDYNGGSLFTLLDNGVGTITIEAKKSNIEFFNPSGNSGVTVNIINEPQVPLFVYDSILNGEADLGICTNVKVTVTTSNPMVNLLAPVEILGVNASEVSFDYVRGTNFQVICEDANGQITTSHTTPFFLADPVVSVVSTPTGATASVVPQTTLQVQYSLDGVNYQNSNTFPGLGDGSFTMYARDQFNCVKTTPFSVNEFTPDVGVTEPFTYISNTNSIRFKKDEVWDNNNIFRNDSNTLSFEEQAMLLVPFIHKFTDQDVVPLQLKTNYESIKVTLENCTNDTEDDLVVLEKTNNLNKVDVRDAIAHEFADGTRYGFYFISGNTYEDDNPLNTVKESYELNGALPAWGKIGNYFSVNFGAYVKIIDIVVVESINAEVLVTDATFFGQPTDVILRAQYNVFNWNAYEFDIDMSLYLNQEFQLKVELTDSNFDDVTFISEKVQVFSDLTDRLTIEAYNTENNDVVYQTGIKHLARVDYDLNGLADESELSLHKADDNVYQLDGYSYDKKVLSLTRMSTMIARQLRQMFTLDEITINGVKCKIEEITTPTRIGITNVYKMDVTYYEVIDKPVTGTLDVDVELDIIDVPALVLGNDEFIKQ